jgi:hypothetical protein
MIDGVFRFNPAVELVVYDRLEPAARARFEALTRDSTFYGVLTTPTTAKAVDRDSALLLLTLRTPGAIPQYALRALGERARRTIAAWVLDGVLEVEHDGRFVSGAEATPLLDTAVREGAGAGAGASAVERLSTAALRYAAALPIRDAGTLARRLYQYNHAPLSPAYRRRYDAETDEERLGLTTSRARQMLARAWTPIPAAGRPWLSWMARHQPGDGAGAEGMYKLYVSPAVDAVRAVVADVVAAIEPCRPVAWKIGAGVHGLLRPDKMVIYFARRDDLHGAATAVSGVVAGVAAHGVPFTSPVDTDGVVSWGVDPPDGEGMESLIRSESWRERLTNRIGAALLQAPRDDGIDAVVRFVRLRLQAHGVDPSTWTPS